MKRAGGLTLIELMVALAVFAALGILSWRALSHMSVHQGLISDELARVRELGRAMLRVEVELLQIAPPVLAGGARATPVVAWRRLPGEGEHELQLLVVDGGRQSVSRNGFRFVDERLEWVRWPGREPEGEARGVLLLERVRAVRWRFLHEGRLLVDWPPDNAVGGTLPQAIELELELADAGKVTRLFALR